MTTLSPTRRPRISVRPTMRDVARVAGVSLKTVSRVVNGEERVNAETAAKVRAAVEQLGYRRNDVARHLRRRSSTLTTGLIIEDVADPFYSILTRAVEDTARAHGYLVFVGNSGEDPQRERELAAAFSAYRTDGLVVIPIATDHRFLTREIELGTAVVFVDRPGRGVDADTVLSDNRAAAKRAVEHLASHGHRRIGFVGNEAAVYTANERFLGYRSGLTAAGISFDRRIARRGPRDVQAAERAVIDMLHLDDPPTALFTANNRMSVGALRALRKVGVQVGLVGFDDFELADGVDPPVTVVAQDPYAMGQTAAELLFSRIGGDRRRPRTITLPTRLIVRGSGELVPT